MAVIPNVSKPLYNVQISTEFYSNIQAIKLTVKQPWQKWQDLTQISQIICMYIDIAT